MSYGWCQSCLDRVGHKLFRELKNGRCAECTKKFGIAQNPQPQPEPKPAPKSKPVSKPKTAPKHLTSRSGRISDDERKLVNWLQSTPPKKYWKLSAAKDLGWPIEKVKKVSRKVRQRKLFKSPEISLDKLILSALNSSPQTVAELAEKLPIKFNLAWMTHTLRKLRNSGKVFAVRKDVTKSYAYYKSP